MTAAGESPRRRRRPRLSRERIVEAALAGDLATLTMRELAARLDVAHSALYRWVKDRESLFDLISEVMVERILPAAVPEPANWRAWLTDLAWAMHDTFLAVPGYASYVARPHRHDPASFGRLMDLTARAFRAGGASPEMAEQSCYIFGSGVVQWLGAREAGFDMHGIEPRFDLYLGVLLAGLPATDAAARPRPSG